MNTTKKSLAVIAVVFTGALGFAPAASASIHSILESFDCASAAAFANHPLGDVAEPPGVTPGFGSHSDSSSLRSLTVTSDGFTHFKLNGECGHSGP